MELIKSSEIIHNLISSNFAQDLLKIVDFSLNKYKDEITKLIFYFKKEKTPTRKWFELIYCILAGTQVRTLIVKKCFEALLNNINTDLMLENLNNTKNIEERIQETLKENGYRFNFNKAITIINAANFFKKYQLNPNSFLSKSNDYVILRKELCQIKGIGIKIASHWLRNVGINLPIIDIHIKNILFFTGIVKTLKITYKRYEEHIFDLSSKLKIDITALDLSIWIFGRENCANKRCADCIIRKNCKKNLVKR